LTRKRNLYSANLQFAPACKCAVANGFYANGALTRRQPLQTSSLPVRSAGFSLSEAPPPSPHRHSWSTAATLSRLPFQFPISNHSTV